MSPSQLLCLMGAMLTFSGCSTLGYYQQAIGGHLSVTSQRQPIEHLVANPETPGKLRAQLKKVNEIRAFAARELDLPAQKAYSSYVDLERRYVVWNVFSAPEFSLQAKIWCYPFVGCASYRGYYSETNARQYANKLRAQGMDVYVAGVTAYSTLGWFNDPVLNTFIFRSDVQLANLIFHELAHQKLYIKGDTLFNESFATVVAREGVKRWLDAQQNPTAYQDFLKEENKQQQFVERVLKYRNRLNELYQSDISDEQKRLQKHQIIAALRDAHQQLKDQWGGESNYERWFTGSLNNAQLNTVATYFDLVPELEALLAEKQFNFSAFYRASEAFARKQQTQAAIK